MAEGSEPVDFDIDEDCEEVHAINLSFSFVGYKCSRAPRNKVMGGAGVGRKNSQVKSRPRLCLSCGKPMQKIGHARKNGANHADGRWCKRHKACLKAMHKSHMMARKGGRFNSFKRAGKRRS